MIKFFKSKSKKSLLLYFLGLLLALGLFIYLRLLKLDLIPVFVDEAIYLRWAQVMKAEPSLRFLPMSDGKQPLFMWILMPLLSYFPDPLIAGRVLSVISGLGTFFGISILSLLITQSLTVSVISAFFYALCPFFVFYNRLSLVDSMLAGIGIWTLILGYLYVKKPRWDLAMILGAILGAGLLTKSPAIFFIAWQPILALFFFKLPRKNQGKKKRYLSLLKLVGGWLLAIFVSLIFYNILRLGTNFHMVGSRNLDYIFPLSEAITHPFNPLIGNFKSTISWTWFLFTPPVFLAALFAFNRKDNKYSLPLIIISLLPLFAQAFVAKVYTPRYILYAVTPLIIVSALGFNALLRRSRIQKLISIPIIIFVFCFVSSFRLVTQPEKVEKLPFRMRNGYLEEWTAGYGQKEIADYLIDLEEQGNTIVVGTEGFFGTLPDGLQIYTQGHLDITVIGVGQPILILPESLVNTSKEHLIFLVVNYSRDKLPQSEKDKLDLVMEFPKAIRADGTQEKLLLYQFK